LILAVQAGSQTLSLLLLVRGWRQEGTVLRGLALFAVSGAVYGYEIAIGLRLWSSSTDTHALTSLLQILLGGYGIGLVRAWELLGASSGKGLVANALGWLRVRLGTTDARINDPHSSEQGPRGPDES
jgi:hypothetical protein